ncbi:uncharacterized protein LOC109533289 [Dendroctonus ponderosae]|uniref:CHK kinase-like domain-containing protein n=1 Tax=Dendroctonus ponderosae TaxID=77166 RepID=U4UUU1_DENPD|nr:uncharacterized protein LOC109533289 [Dendroctonus ponderosae]ERL93971.1 hypothetical protein D910_11256 [Dendroctonus ponderosae]KAH1027631.1 hypothetical protein HUJ05_001107 [Dendroctonus ponderosae]
MTTCIQSEINQWVADTFKENQFKDLSAEIVGTSEQGEGYLGNITFAKVTGVPFSGKAKEFHVVIKSEKRGDGTTNLSPVQLAYERENFFYDKAVPAFQEIEKKYGINITQQLFPKCFSTLSYEDQQLIVLQNLKSLDFELYDRHQPFDMEHLKVTLSNYGKFHALSLAYREHKPKEFKELFSGLPCAMKNIIELTKNSVDAAEKCLYMMLEENQKFKAAEKLKELLPDGVTAKIQQMLRIQEHEENAVLVHGDCWNNNYMFKYPKQEKTLPESVKFLDFQVTKLSSPVMDLSYHIYATASEKELAQLKELLQIYYSSLSSMLKKLGCDPEKVFPYEELIRQWKKYSCFGFAMSSFVLQIVLLEKEDTIDIEAMGGENVTANMLKSNNSLNKIYSRLSALVEHYLEFDDF